ncbi:hypothetical protein [Nonomuraea roseoviolacea]|uniref:Uncharacterized protein n=1 Tax=Nonomuraea roseoviolacea subsp. carminata TaxID=160689 RepID=A0ABT1K5J8_9ACTN|nr:hypothetical protein [Nonomuraea roseoviolacea]MCP2349278.1 hypothetical protein [Nonomuraea roseoviolacea subsp. carminata]
MTRRRTPRRSVIRLTTGHTARTLRHPYGPEPMLALDFGATSVLITTTGPVTGEDLEFARQLAREAARFAWSTERAFHATTDPTNHTLHQPATDQTAA